MLNHFLWLFKYVLSLILIPLWVQHLLIYNSFSVVRGEAEGQAVMGLERGL